MAGIYVHVPFCKVKCHYCDFHFSVQLKNRKDLVLSIVKELELRTDFLEDELIKTIYFGGGTPSLLEVELIEKILETIHHNFRVSDDCEVTLECNPDDLNKEKLIALYALGVNRLSIGIQSFNDEVLTFMNRSHNADQAKSAVELAQHVGFKNMTIDLIYGVPGSTMDSWKKELNQMLELEVPHLSAYCLTIEENTVFGDWLKKGKLSMFSDEESLKQFQYLMDFASKNEYEQYEISNFSKNGFISRHNSAYWRGEKYLGVGPSAHSYNLTERGWNIANNPKYVKCISDDLPFYENEILSEQDKLNDYLLTRLRTKWGIEMDDLVAISPKLAANVKVALSRYLQQKQLRMEGNAYVLTDTGKYLADGISADLFQ